MFSGNNKKNISKCCMFNFVSADILEHFHIFPIKQFDISCKSSPNVKCLLEKIRIINILSAENAQSANHQFSADDTFFIVFLFFFLRKLDLKFHVHFLN